MPHSFRFALVASCLLSCAALRADYDPKIIAGDARWVVYLDCNALRGSTLGAELIKTVQKSQADTPVGSVGVDASKLLTTIGSLTAYGTNFSDKATAIDGTLIAQGTPELRKIAESVLLQGTIAQPKVFSEVTDLPFPAYAISNPNEKTAEHTQLVIAFPPEPVVIASKSKAQLLKARDVLLGKAPSLARSGDSPLNKFAANASGAYLYGASLTPTGELLGGGKDGPHARILQLAHAGSLVIGERGPDTFAHAELEASSKPNAEKLTKILQGMAAMLSLAETNDQQLAAFIQSTSVSREGDTVRLDLAYASARLVQMIQNMQAQGDPRPTRRTPVISSGNIVGEWGGDGVAPPDGGEPVSHTIENVKLANGSTITLGRSVSSGKQARFIAAEITPAVGTGAPLVFRSDFMRGFRGTMSQFQFPGTDGTYTIKVTYVPDPEGKSKFAVSVSDPKPASEVKTEARSK
jgi:hypothetical protein